MKMDGQVLCLKVNHKRRICDIHHVCGSDGVPGSIIGFQEVIIADEKTALKVALFLGGNGEGSREDSKACCRVGFIGRQLKTFASKYLGRYAEVEELPENSLDISVRRKSEHGVGLACFTCLDIIFHKEVIDIDVDKLIMWRKSPHLPEKRRINTMKWSRS